LELKAQAPVKEKEAEKIKQQTGAEAGKKWSDNDSMMTSVESSIGRSIPLPAPARI